MSLIVPPVRVAVSPRFSFTFFFNIAGIVLKDTVKKTLHKRQLVVYAYQDSQQLCTIPDVQELYTGSYTRLC